MRAALIESFRQALAQTHPSLLTKAHLPQQTPSLIIAVGKAALTMLEAAREVFPQTTFLAVPKDGSPVQTRWGQVIPAAHPVPDARSVQAAQRVLEAVSKLTPEDFLLLLISGGGSSLLCAPWGVSLELKRSLTQALLRSGADIQEINTVRKHLSQVKGGRLAAATPARILALYLSDVPGDDLSVIASGPTVPDGSTFGDALEVLDKYGLDFPQVRDHLTRGVRGQLPESPKPGDPVFSRVENRIIGSNQTLLEAARAYWQQRGYLTAILSDRFQGEARELARFHAALVDSIRVHQTPFRPPVVLLSGGEASVTVQGPGQGGRNQEFLAWLAFYLSSSGVWALAADSDGVDGNTEAAGALISPETPARARALGLELKTYLRQNNSSRFFAALGDLLITGPTANNLNDFRVILVEPTHGVARRI
ncbi:MAG: glycerate kinase [Thermaceae bacterium]|nr:glycerate kinase [Thermaceae bacterium]